MCCSKNFSVLIRDYTDLNTLINQNFYIHPLYPYKTYVCRLVVITCYGSYPKIETYHHLRQCLGITLQPNPQKAQTWYRKSPLPLLRYSLISMTQTLCSEIMFYHHIDSVTPHLSKISISISHIPFWHFLQKTVVL